MRRFVAPGPPIPPSGTSSGLAENAWDFNDPNAMPGFGPLDCSAEQLDALVGRIVGGVAQRSRQRCDPGRGSQKQERRSVDSGHDHRSGNRSTEPMAALDHRWGWFEERTADELPLQRNRRTCSKRCE